ncbi:hypothetical protein HDU87_001214 [Geranomyces variabilis]|uniref:Uncharacterized protein n=1 Tax=Geranomyces variabilis TaxID=109894 RepID=A0AAD5XJ37_9FUNG|nr:hypothetical protein HDU87_001214 [Geranomyces variabilis]
MVQIVLPTTIASSDRDAGVDGTGHVLLELQGSLSTDGTESLAGVHLGHFNVCPTTGTPTLSIGHHKLEGRRVELRKPFAVVRKRQRQDSAASKTLPPPPSSSQPQSPPQSQSDPQQNPTTHHTHHPPPVRLELSLSLSQGPDSMTTMMTDDVDPPPPQHEEEPHPQPHSQTLDTTTTHHLYDVVAVLRFKYLFKSRPEHVLAEEHKGLIALPRR